MAEIIQMTCIVVARDGRVFDLSKGEYPSTSKSEEYTPPWFAQTCTRGYCAKLKAMSNGDCVRFLKAEMY